MKRTNLTSQVMREMGRKGGKAGGSKGGKARMAALSPEERSENARRAARIRWAKEKQASGTSAKKQ
jgi:hypothetical protein